MAQPPLSQRVQRLERELGVRLFDRSPRRVALTPAGRDLLPLASNTLAAAEELRARAARLVAGATGVMRVGLPPELPAAAIARLVGTTGAATDGLRIEPVAMTSAEQVTALADRELDVATVRLPADLRASAGSVTLHQRWGVAVPSGSPLAVRPSVALAELGGRPLALFPRASAPGFYDQLLDRCAEAGYVPPLVHHPTHLASALGLVLADAALALLDATGTTGQDGVSWRPLAGEPVVARCAVAWRTGIDGDVGAAVAASVASALCDHLGMARATHGTGPQVRVRPASGTLM